MEISFFRSLMNSWTRLTGKKATNSNSKCSQAKSSCGVSNAHLYLRIAELKEEIRLLRLELDKEFDL